MSDKLTKFVLKTFMAFFRAVYLMLGLFAFQAFWESPQNNKDYFALGFALLLFFVILYDKDKDAEIRELYKEK
jgi:hypothetical protein